MGKIGRLLGNALGQAVGGAAGQALGKFTGIGGAEGRNIGGDVGGSILEFLIPFKQGGKVTKTTKALLHKGEYVLPKGVKPTKAQIKAVMKRRSKKRK